MGAKWIHLGIA